ncbi:MAG: aminomethyl-transferring glycine dehydrogenase subunit GcvPB [Desulfurococcaceae archaeon]
MFRQAKWDEPLVFEMGCEDRVGYLLPEIEDRILEKVGDIKLPEKIIRKKEPNLPSLSEVEVIRHYTRLTQMSYGVDCGPVPLGSCTMKYNPRFILDVVQDRRITSLHPLQDESTVQGLLEIMYMLQKWLAYVTGMDYCSLHPAAGAHGELAGVLIMRKYHELKNQLDVKKEIILPDSAHGTNPASAAMAGFRVVEVPSGEDGCVDLDALKSVVSESTAGFMITNPNTLGIFEKNIREIANILHSVDALLYYDGANLNGIMGYSRPGDMGFDIAHINIHKTFGSPHGGGGPGAGPVCVKDRIIDREKGISLKDLLPGLIVEYENGKYRLVKPKHSIGMLRSFFANTIPLVWGFTYMLMLGSIGLREVAEHAVLNTNYFLESIRSVRGYTLEYGENLPRKHEVTISARVLNDETGVTAEDLAKGLLDRGLHAPTIYFPLIVKESLMIEFTESETIENIDKYIDALREMSEVAYRNPMELKKYPQNTSVKRVDNVKANHPKTLAPTWRIYVKRKEGVNV